MVVDAALPMLLTVEAVMEVVLLPLAAAEMVGTIVTVCIDEEAVVVVAVVVDEILPKNDVVVEVVGVVVLVVSEEMNVT